MLNKDIFLFKIEKFNTQTKFRRTQKNFLLAKTNLSKNDIDLANKEAKIIF